MPRGGKDHVPDNANAGNEYRIEDIPRERYPGLTEQIDQIGKIIPRGIADKQRGREQENLVQRLERIVDGVHKARHESAEHRQRANREKVPMKERFTRFAPFKTYVQQAVFGSSYVTLMRLLTYLALLDDQVGAHHQNEQHGRNRRSKTHLEARRAKIDEMRYDRFRRIIHARETGKRNRYVGHGKRCRKLNDRAEHELWPH